MKKGLISVGMVASMSITGICFAAKTPAINGSELLEARCSICHPSSRPKGLKKTPKQWETTVKRMVAKGAKLSNDEKMILVDYLSKTYKP